MGFEEGDVAIHMSEKSQAGMAKIEMECHGVLHGDRRLYSGNGFRNTQTVCC